MNVLPLSMPDSFEHMPSIAIRLPNVALGRGSTWRTWLHLEDERRAFERYRAIRERERKYLLELAT